MNNNLPIKKSSIIERIKNFFKKLFFKESKGSEIKELNNVENATTEKENILTTSEQQNEWISKYQNTNNSQTKNEYVLNNEREEFLDKIGKNPKMLYDLSIDRLEELEGHYKESIEKLEGRLSKLQKANQ